MHQHQICIGFNPARIIIGSELMLLLKLGTDTKRMVHSVTMEDQDIEAAQEELCQYAAPLCKEVLNAELPPFRNINHTIPLIDEEKTYPWQPSRCPEIFQEQWVEKKGMPILNQAGGR